MALKKSGEKVFVSVGTHPQQFDRLLSEIDMLTGEGKIPKKVFAQTGHSIYRPENYEWSDFLTLGEFDSKLSGCEIFITHAGEGNIGKAKNMGKKMICVPRRKEFGEHTNDHQLELAKVVEDKKIGLVAWNPAQLEVKVDELQKFAPAKIARGNIPHLIENFVRRI